MRYQTAVPKDNLFDFIDVSCDKNKCDKELFIKWDWKHWVTVTASSVISDTYTKAEVDNMFSHYYDKDFLNTQFAKYYTKTEITNILNGYYTKNEIDLMIENYYTKQEINNMFSNYYTKEEIDNLVNDNPEEVRFAIVTMDGDRETDFSHPWITADCDAIITWLDGEPNGFFETYVTNGKIIIKSSQNESWRARIRFSKPKPNGYLN